MTPMQARTLQECLWAAVFSANRSLKWLMKRKFSKINAWVAFKKYGTKQGDLMMDGGSMGIPVSLLPEALQKVAKSIPIAELSAIVARQQYPSKALLKWQEFSGLVHEIYHLNRNTLKQGQFGGVMTPGPKKQIVSIEARP